MYALNWTTCYCQLRVSVVGQQCWWATAVIAISFLRSPSPFRHNSIESLNSNSNCSSIPPTLILWTQHYSAPIVIFREYQHVLSLSLSHYIFVFLFALSLTLLALMNSNVRTLIAVTTFSVFLLYPAILLSIIRLHSRLSISLGAHTPLSILFVYDSWNAHKNHIPKIVVAFDCIVRCIKVAAFPIVAVVVVFHSLSFHVCLRWQ